MQPFSLLLLIVNVRGRECFEEGTVSKKEPVLDLGRPWYVQIPKDATGRKFSLRKLALVKDQGQGWIAFADEMRYASQGSNQISHQKPGRDPGGLILKGSERTLWFIGTGPLDIYERPTRF